VNRGDWKLFPNIYTILVGNTGIGKGRSINPAVGLLRESGCADILSDKLTIQYVLQYLADKQQQVANITIGGKTLHMNGDTSCFISAPEIEEFLTMSETMPTLKELWESKDGMFQYGTRTRGMVTVSKPCPTILGGCTPSQIAHLFPTYSVGGGFVRRCNFIHECNRTCDIPWPIPSNGNDPRRRGLVEDLKRIGQLSGEFKFDSMARSMFEKYYKTRGSNEFSDEATDSYGNSKPYHALKLAMSMAVARNDRLTIDMYDMGEAIKWTDQCEADISRVFRSVGDSESTALMDKVLRFVEARYKYGPVTRRSIMAALWKDVGTPQQLDLIMGGLISSEQISENTLGGQLVYKIPRPKRMP
jgi:hypothetical protein